MNKFSLIQESVVLDKNLILKIGELDYYRFLPYTLKLRQVVEKILQPFSTEVNFNNDRKYQKPLNLLYSTGKYPEIKKYDTKFWSHKLKMNLVLIGGNWHPVNKLNTNSFDQAELLCDLITKEGLIDDIKKTYENESDMKSWLIKFCSENDIESLIKKHNLILQDYTKYNRLLSEYGDKAESEVASYLENDGYSILYRGGDGDPTDMVFGVDLIISKSDIIQTVQVKRTKSQALKASQNKNYSRIDLFFYSQSGNIGSI